MRVSQFDNIEMKGSTLLILCLIFLIVGPKQSFGFWSTLKNCMFFFFKDFKTLSSLYSISMLIQ